MTELQEIKQKYKYYKYLVLSLCITLFGSKIVGIYCLYQVANINDIMICNPNDIETRLVKHTKKIHRCLGVGIFVFALKLFVLFIFILGMALSLASVGKGVTFG